MIEIPLNDHHEEISNSEAKSSIEELLLPEQRQLLSNDLAISNLTLDENGRITGLANQTPEPRFEEWTKKPGVIDAKEIFGSIVVVYNANSAIPDGCPDLRKSNRSGEYSPEDKICFVDISNTWDFLNDQYQPAWVQQFVRHELRHHLVAQLDEKYSEKNQVVGRRNLDWDNLSQNHPEDAQQLAYLDELHSQYADVIEGTIDGSQIFQKIESKMYSIAGAGPHLEISAIGQKGKTAAAELFYCLQAMILIKRMSERTEMIKNDQITKAIYSVGAVLGSERSVTAAKNKIQEILSSMLEIKGVKNNIKEFVSTYQPNGQNNDPLVTSELLNVLDINKTK